MFVRLLPRPALASFRILSSQNAKTLVGNSLAMAQAYGRSRKIGFMC